MSDFKHPLYEKASSILTTGVPLDTPAFLIGARVLIKQGERIQVRLDKVPDGSRIAELKVGQEFDLILQGARDDVGLDAGGYFCPIGHLMNDGAAVTVLATGARYTAILDEADRYVASTMERVATHAVSRVPFKVGDKVSVFAPLRGDIGILDTDVPGIVVRVLDRPIRAEATKPEDYSTDWYARELDVAVACMMYDGHVKTFLFDSLQLEPYVPATQSENVDVEPSWTRPH